jgi:hypothetical protein
MAETWEKLAEQRLRMQDQQMEARTTRSPRPAQGGKRTELR